MKRRKIKLRYKKERVLFSDVLPYELPLTFTNRYYYRFLVQNGIRIENEELHWNSNISKGALNILSFIFNANKENLERDGKMKIKDLKTIPFMYRIQHKPNKYRELSIIHPANQIEIVDFYEKYKSLILYYCNQDKFSLRHPSKVACYFFYRDRLHQTLLGRKTDKIELYLNEYENLRTYFSYERYNNIYKFYEDYRYQRAEKKFSKLIKFDIQNCFDSIYTHSMAWAVSGGKSIYKEHFQGSDDLTFGYRWDKIMQHIAYNETNGVVIGPEFSRIFAETILQHVDVIVESALLQQGIKWNVDYVCYRYVDDFFFFYNDDKIREKSMLLFTNALKGYRLSVSSEKTQLIERPFVTNITRAKICIDQLINEALSFCKDKDKTQPLGDNIIEEHNGDLDTEETIISNIDSAKIQKIIDDNSYFCLRANDFNQKFKAILKETEVEGKDVLNYTLACIGRKLELGLKKFDETFKCLSMALNDATLSYLHQNCEHAKQKKEKMLKKFLWELLDSVFFLYSDSKRINTTLKVINILNLMIITLNNPYIINGDKIHRFSDYIRDDIFKKIQDEIILVFQTSKMDENTQLETLYFLIVMRSLRSKYNISPAKLQEYLGISHELNGDLKYYPQLNGLSIIILLYFFGNSQQYEIMKFELIKQIIDKVKATPKTLRRISSELVLLTLDVITCPYIGCSSKQNICKKMGITPKQLIEIEKYMKQQKFMFTKWTGIDITKEINAKISQEVYA
jgi:hypothetical protein